MRAFNAPSAAIRIAIVLSCTGFAPPAATELIEVALKRGEAVEKRLAVQPGKFAELCSALKQNQTVNWRFRSGAAMDFNIHYHVDKRVEYPEQRKSIKDGNGRLVVEADQNYCWMWTNHSDAPVHVDVILKLTGR